MTDTALTGLAWCLTASFHCVAPEDAAAAKLRRDARRLGFIVGMQLAVGFRSRRNVSEMLRLTAEAVGMDWRVEQ